MVSSTKFCLESVIGMQRVLECHRNDSITIIFVLFDGRKEKVLVGILEIQAFLYNTGILPAGENYGHLSSKIWPPKHLSSKKCPLKHLLWETLKKNMSFNYQGGRGLTAIDHQPFV